MFTGSCLCGVIAFCSDKAPEKMSHCHCRMCQKQHGAAFATYVSLNVGDFRYTKGENFLSSYNSSGTIERKFCSQCGSNLEWSGSEDYPDWIAIPAAAFDSEVPLPKHDEIVNYFLDSKVCWLEGDSFA